MKIILHVILKYYLNILARIVLLRCRPAVIAIAGSVNKAFFKQAITNMLHERGIASASTFHAFNTEIGLPLTILGLKSGYESYGRWARILPQALRAAWKRRLPSVLVLELGAEHAGDMAYLTRLTKPRIAVITGLTRRYLENFGSIASAVQEYRSLAVSIPAAGLVIANYDSPELRGLHGSLRAALKFFTIETEPAEDRYAALNIERTEKGMAAELMYASRRERIALDRFGNHHVAAYVAARIIEDNLHLVQKIR